MRQTLKEYCIQFNRQELLDQWHTEKNGELRPDTITSGSSRKVWWRCEKGHEWQSCTYTRTKQGSGCPYCKGTRLLPGNDFESLFPELAAQWHPVKNHGLLPSQVSKGSHRLVWWVCENGHEWQAVVKSRTGGTGCPYCTNKKILVGENDLATTHPDLAAQWHPTKNGALTPKQVVMGTVRKVWWQCSEGHEWRAQISARTMGSGCPVCSNRKIIPGVNDFASCFPHLADQWVYEKNLPLRPDQVSVFSNKRVWWQCSLGHQWQNTVAHRTKTGSDCPVCANKVVLSGFNDLQFQMPEIAKEWHPTLNGKRTPEMVTVGSSQHAWWRCNYGHVWKAVISSRTGKGKCGCPACAGKIKQAKQRYYEALERDTFLREQANKSAVAEEVWQESNTPASLADKEFGRWLVCNDVVTGPSGDRRWRCRCRCGTEKYVSERSLLEGRSLSCGCYAVERIKEELTHDLAGQTFGELYVLGRAATPEGKKGVWWDCRCSCGKRLSVLASLLTTGRKTNCGCKTRSKIKDLTGQRFGKLTVKEITEKRSACGYVIWRCVCDCGNILELPSDRLVAGKVMDCGCQNGKKML